MKYLFIYICLIISIRLNAQVVEPVIDTSFTIGGEGVDHMEVVRELDDRQILMAGTSNSEISGEVSIQNQGLSDYWVMHQDTGTVFGMIWDRMYGGDSTEILGDMEILSDGFILVGSSASGVSGNKTSVNKGGFDYWIVRCDLDGNILWDRTYGGSDNDTATTVEITPDGGFLIGGYSVSMASGDKSEDCYGADSLADFWILKLNATGALLWEITVGGDGTEHMRDAFTYDGGYYCVGYSDSDSSGLKSQDSYGGYDYWNVKIDNGGNYDFDVTYGGNQDDFGEVIKKQSGGPIIIGGTTFSGASGVKTSPAFGQEDCWIFQIDSAAQMQWDFTFGGDQRDECYDMYSTPEGGVAVGATSLSGTTGNKESASRGGSDYWIYKLDSAGNKVWDYAYGGFSNDEFRTIHQGCDRGFLIGGYSKSDISAEKLQDSRGGDDYWVIRTLLPTRPSFMFDDVCYGSTVSFYDESDIWPDTWSWDFGDPLSSNNTSIDQHPLHDYSSPGIYQVTLFIKEGCQADTFFTDSVTIYENPILSLLDLGEDDVLCINETRNIDAGAMPVGSTYEWSTGETTQDITVDSIGVYTCVVRNGACYEQDVIELAPCPIIYIPNAFTPNNDGLNEFFFVHGEGIEEMDLYIFDRWGELIFHTQDPNEGWDARPQQGKQKLAEIEVYPYLLVYRGLGTQYFRKVGHVTVIR